MVPDLLDQIDAKQANLQKTIGQAEEVVKSVDAVLSKASTTLQDFERGARALDSSCVRATASAAPVPGRSSKGVAA